jgi:hypothetical protein
VLRRDPTQREPLSVFNGRKINPAVERQLCKATTMSRSTDPGHFFQTDASESIRARKAAKSVNKNGNPIILQSKILNVIPDPSSSTSIYIAESVGCVRKVNVEVGMRSNIYRLRGILTGIQRLGTRRPSTKVQLHHSHQ